jgi:hypothetical protein
MTAAEIEILRAGAANPNIFCDYWFRKPNQEHGWMLDWNFESEGKWQETMCMATQSFIVAICGISCADIDSHLYDVELGRYVSFRWLLDNKRAPVVLARGISGWAMVQATLPFYKGKARAKRLSFSNGNTITVSLDHRFMTASQGFVRTRDLRLGDVLIAPHILPAFAPSATVDVRDLSGKSSGFQGDYSFHPHQYDVQPRPDEEVGQVPFQRQDDVLQPNHLISSDPYTPLARVQSYKNYPSYYNSHHRQRQDFFPPHHRASCSVFGDNGQPTSDERAQDRSLVRGHQQFSGNSNQDLPDVSVLENKDQVSSPSFCGELYHSEYASDFSLPDTRDLAVLSRGALLQPSVSQIDQQVFEVLPDPCFSPKNNKWDYYTPIITKIEDVGEIDLYDIHVPGYENYVMEGVVSHNSGKTVGVVMGAAYHAALTQLFKFMNVAPSAWQSMLMYRALMEQVEGTPFEKLIVSAPKRPWPQVALEYYIGTKKFSSLLEFQTLGEEGTAENIFSYRGDWINIEEAGKIDDLGVVVTNLVTRLTGGTAENRPYLGRLSLISNPWENPELWQLYDMAAADKEDGLVFNIDTKYNKNTTDKQIRFALKMIPKELHNRFMTGDRPQGKGSYFPASTVDPCLDAGQSEIVLNAIDKGEAGYEMETLPHMGAFYLRQPRKAGRQYFIIGDPGTGVAPSRNAPCIIVFDVTEAPVHSPIVAFWWGNGAGSIMPFVSRFIEWIDTYGPILAAVDNTGPQKSTAELISTDYIYGKKKSVISITGLDFSGAKRYSYLVALRLSLESKMLSWPSICTGIGSQLKNYDPIADKASGGKLAQDVVATLAMGAFAIRAYYGDFGEENSSETGDDSPGLVSGRRHDRNEVRTRRRDEAGSSTTWPR